MEKFCGSCRQTLFLTVLAAAERARFHQHHGDKSSFRVIKRAANVLNDLTATFCLSLQ